MNLILHELVDQVRSLTIRTVSRLDVRQVWAEPDRIKFRTGDGGEGDIQVLVNRNVDGMPTGARRKGEP